MQTEQTVIEAIIKAMGITRADIVIPGRGDPQKFEIGQTVLRFKRPGTAGEFQLTYKLDHIPEFVPIAERGSHGK